MIYLGPEGNDFLPIKTLKNVLSDALNIYQVPQTPLDERNFQIISIHPVLASESQKLGLVAITSTGISHGLL